MKVILFDGVCNFCSASVRFIIERDPHAYFRFASLQSEAGQKLLRKHGVPERIDSLVFIDGSAYYTKSSAALNICKHLRGWWKYFYIFVLIPRPLRDYVYDWVAKNRYKWFGKANNCLIPTEEIRKRFL
ncbi:thiol-disulfide oxidoreductase DCC family protein [Anoxybacteroides tepidamans]|uniref:thiol-disulfide oxidoreductase DCC family protein n=1 Tax=Anoxybacteroides tepidamans TaxID=265948 RepID=UPI00048200DB|nr:thiol-disulfide oxidoreductase DCC family protein [Anoxybacillus tepidamans]